MHTLILADNQEITKAGILYLSEKMSDIALVTEAENKGELIQLLIRYPEAIVVLDYTLFDLSGPDELVILQDRFRHSAWLLFSEDLSEDFLRRLIFNSQRISVVMKDSPLEEIRMALQLSISSNRFICQRIAALFSGHKQDKEQKEHPILTATEREILKSIALGKTTKEIAAERFSSIHTITTHRKNIFRKLEVNNIHEATRYALRAGIIDAAEYYI